MYRRRYQLQRTALEREAPLSSCLAAFPLVVLVVHAARLPLLVAAAMLR